MHVSSVNSLRRGNFMGASAKEWVMSLLAVSSLCNHFPLLCQGVSLVSGSFITHVYFYFLYKPALLTFSFLDQVYYLHFLDFVVRTMDPFVPRFVACKGHIVKYYSELDRKTPLAQFNRSFDHLPTHYCVCVCVCVDAATREGFREKAAENKSCKMI
jgi:hypothetical protein